MSTFDQVYLLNLYGNARTNQEQDTLEESIFSIQAGVAIAFMVKTSAANECRVVHAGINGSRAHKLQRLSEMSIHSTPWQEVNPRKPFSVFVPVSHELQDEFYSFASLFDLFKEHSIGFVTSRDAFAIDTDREALLHRIGKLRDTKISAHEIRAIYPVTDLDIEKTREALLADPNWQDKAIEVLYRPFDKRWAYYTRGVMERPRLPFMESLMQDNLALAIGRAGQATGSATWDVAFITAHPTDLNLFRRGGAMLFPLYSYKHGARQYNLVQPDSEFFYYIYAILHSQTYRERYSECLSIDYPRIPISPSSKLVAALAKLGEELAKVHLLRDTGATPKPIIEPMRIGGWDIPGKYLADRKGKELSIAEKAHLTHIREAVQRTHELQRTIDDLISRKAPWHTT